MIRRSTRNRLATQSTARVVLVTGASSGIGEATVRRLLADGHVVYGAARRVERMTAIAEAGARIVSLDITDEASVTAAVEQILGEAGRIDVLVNNAGYGSYGALEDVPIDEARRQFEVNIFGLARITQLVLPSMRERRRGLIINISSVGGRIYEPLGSWYHATKFALEGLSDSLRIELAPHGVRVVIVQPGPITTEWNGIARASAIERSGEGPYGAQARALQRSYESIDASSASAPAEAVADTIGAIVRSRHPRTRYATPFAAKLIVGARRVLPDVIFDAIVTRAFGVRDADRAAAARAKAARADGSRRV